MVNTSEKYERTQQGNLLDLSTLSAFCLFPSVLQLLMIDFVVFIFSFVNFVLTLALTKKIRTFV